LLKGHEIAILLWSVNPFKLFIVAANLFQDAEESDAATKFWETPSGQDVMPDLRMLRYKNFDPP
jgi:hypothetical protein